MFFILLCHIQYVAAQKNVCDIFARLRDTFEELVKIPGAVRYKCSIFGKKIDKETAHLVCVVFPDAIFYKENAKKHLSQLHSVGANQRLTTFEFDFVDKIVKIDTRSETEDKNWSINITPTSENQLEILKEDCNRNPHPHNGISPPMCSYY